VFRLLPFWCNNMTVGRAVLVDFFFFENFPRSVEEVVEVECDFFGKCSVVS
jgi:hypothetical protein